MGWTGAAERKGKASPTLYLTQVLTERTKREDGKGKKGWGVPASCLFSKRKHTRRCSHPTFPTSFLRSPLQGPSALAQLICLVCELPSHLLEPCQPPRP